MCVLDEIAKGRVCYHDADDSRLACVIYRTVNPMDFPTGIQYNRCHVYKAT